MPGLTLKDVLHLVVHESKIPARQLAEELGLSYSMLMNCANPELPEFNIRAQKIIPLTKLTGDYRLIDFIEGAVGRVAFSLPEIPAKDVKLDKLIAESVKEFGDVLQEVGSALSDGRIDRIELKRCEKEILDQVRKVMSLLEALRKRVQE